MENIAKIIYINLDKRPDRREAMEQEFVKMGIPLEMVTRFPAVYNPLNGLGCLRSHLEVLKLAKEKQYENVWIMEDDFTFTVDMEYVDKTLKQLFTKNPPFESAMFAYIHKQDPIPPIDKVKYPNIFRIVESQTASSYLVKQHFYDNLINLFEDAYHQLLHTGAHWLYANDQVWKLYQRNHVWYCVSPSFGKQRPEIRDNSAEHGGKMIEYTDQG